MKKEQIKKLKNMNIDFKKNQVILVYLFGSEVKGTSHKESDIDIGVLFDKKVNPKDYLRVEGKLIGLFSEILPEKEINIVNLKIASPLLRQTVVLEGKLLYAKSKIEKILFQVQTLHQYEDYLHLSNIYNQFLRLKLKAL